MRILQLCYKPPVPPVDGGTMAMNSITQGLLNAGHSVRVLSLSSEKHPLRNDDIDPLYLKRTELRCVQVDLSIHPVSAAVALLCGESYNIKRFDTPEFHSLIRQTLESEVFDIIHVESIFLTPYLSTIRQYSKAPVVLRAHNVEHRIWQQIVKNTKRSLKRWYLKKLALALRVYELEHINDYDGIVCITRDDADIFKQEGCRRPITDIPFGININPLDDSQGDPYTLFHIGAMDWKPNVEAIRWFIDEVWPRAKKEMPQLRLHLAGRKMPEELMNLQLEGVTVEGEVPSATRFMVDKQINIVPLRAGSGLRIKIVEAMSLGKTVIATSTAASGIKYTDGEDILIANTPDQFVDQIRQCVNNSNLCHRIGRNAYQLACDNYSIENVTTKLTDFYNKLIH